jgi:hypothetical protein
MHGTLRFGEVGVNRPEIVQRPGSKKNAHAAAQGMGVKRTIS